MFIDNAYRCLRGKAAEGAELVRDVMAVAACSASR
jgi:hypothetical protein